MNPIRKAWLEATDHRHVLFTIVRFRVLRIHVIVVALFTPFALPVLSRFAWQALVGLGIICLAVGLRLWFLERRFKRRQTETQSRPSSKIIQL